VSAGVKRIISPRDLAFLGAVGVLAVVLLVTSPDRTGATVEAARTFLVEMITILPAVVILMGLFAVFVSREFVVRHLGASAGVRGFLVAILLGALPTGPLYVAFPLVKAMRAKGAGTANMVAFISAWACIKLPQEMVEIRFLGLPFAATRLLLTIAAVAVMGAITQRTLARWEPDTPESPPAG
jgi:uncharacterized membrane protein YraQ (UPF0718 family)